jgi:hypothetical protein
MLLHSPAENYKHAVRSQVCYEYLLMHYYTILHCSHVLVHCAETSVVRIGNSPTLTRTRGLSTLPVPAP